jgi:hypothetical protein
MDITLNLDRLRALEAHLQEMPWKYANPLLVQLGMWQKEDQEAAQKKSVAETIWPTLSEKDPEAVDATPADTMLPYPAHRHG